MTLILTAIHKEGLSVLADKRSTTVHFKTGKKEYDDTLNKIYLIEEASLIFFNHGINRFAGISAGKIFEDYKNSSEWKEKTTEEIADNFYRFIQERVEREVSINQKRSGVINLVGFFVCGKNEDREGYECYELIWNPDFKRFHFSGQQMIGTGSGFEKYLEVPLKFNLLGRTVEWTNMNAQETKKYLIKIFNHATQRKMLNSGDEFSDNYDFSYLKI